jgi:hypothetical protein
MEMARRKQRTEASESDAPKRSKLEPAWPSSPTRNPRYVLYCTNHESERQYIVNSYGLYAIRKIFDALTEGQELEPSPLDPERTITFGDIDIKSDELKEIMAHKYSAEEEAWELPVPYPQEIERFLHGPRMSREIEHAEVNEKGDVVRAPPKPKAPKVDRSKFITVQALAEEIGIDPRDARAALRKAKVEKPAGGWLGDEEWAKGIRDVLAKAKKELDKKKGR